MILTALVNSATSTGKFCYQYGNFQNTEAATGGVLKTQIKVSQNSREKTYARISILVKLKDLGLLKKRPRHRYFPVKFVKILRIPFWKAAVSQKMKAFKLQVTSSVKAKIG